MAEEKPEPMDDQAQASGDQSNQVQDLESLPPELLIKHPLQNRWTLWFYKNDKLKAWEENLQEITSFDTVEDFWALYNHIEVASKLQSGCDYSLFKHGIKPMWEDDRNKKGGRWLINLNKSQRSSDLDNFWLETHPLMDTNNEGCLIPINNCGILIRSFGASTLPLLLCLIGEAFEEQSDEICGAVVNVRPKGDKIGVWTADSRKADPNGKIGKKLKERLNIPGKITIGYQAHIDAMSKSGSTAKARYTV